MTIRSWVPTGFRRVAGVAAGYAAVCVAIMLAVTGAQATPAKAHHPIAAPIPSRPHAAPAKHLTVAHKVSRHPAASPVVVKAKAQAASKAKPGASSHAKPAAKSPAPSPGHKSRSAAKQSEKPSHSRRKHHAEDEADGDPLVIYRAEAHSRKSQRGAASYDVAANRHATAATPRDMRAEVLAEPPAREDSKPEDSGLAGVTGKHDRHSLKALKPTPTQPQPAAHSRLPSAGFMRVPATSTTDTGVGTAQPSALRSGHGPPDTNSDAEVVLDPRQPVVSATSEPLTPVGKPTLPEKLHSMALKAETAAKSDAAALKLGSSRQAKPSIMPEDIAERDAIIEEAMVPRVLPNLYNHGGRLVVPPPMKGNHDILVHQNLMADKDGLDRIQNDAELNRMRSSRMLVDLSSTDALEINPQLPENRRSARPWTAKFVLDISRAYYAQFRQPLRLSSAVRTVSYQLRLQRVNGNAAAVEGDGASPHLTGQAIDFGKHGMSMAEIAWMRAYLAPIMDAGKIDVEEEFQQACFHISVYKSYMPLPRKPRMMTVAQVAAAPIVRTEPKSDDPEQEVQ